MLQKRLQLRQVDQLADLKQKGKCNAIQEFHGMKAGFCHWIVEMKFCSGLAKGNLGMVCSIYIVVISSVADEWWSMMNGLGSIY